MQAGSHRKRACRQSSQVDRMAAGLGQADDSIEQAGVDRAEGERVRQSGAAGQGLILGRVKPVRLRLGYRQPVREAVLVERRDVEFLVLEAHAIELHVLAQNEPGLSASKFNWVRIPAMA